MNFETYCYSCQPKLSCYLLNHHASLLRPFIYPLYSFSINSLFHLSFYPLSLSKNLPPVSQSAKLPPPMTNLAHPLQMQTSKFTHNTRARRCEAPTLLIATYCSSWGRKTNLPINVRISKICQIPAGKTGTDQYCRYLDWSAILFYLFRIVPKSLCFVLYQPTW